MRPCSAGGPAQEAGFAGLSQDRRHARRRGERVGGAEAGEILPRDEFCGEHGPHPRQAADEGRVRVAFEQRFDLAVELDEAGAGGERLHGELADQARGHALGRDGDGLLGGGGERAIDQGLDIGHSARGPQVAPQTFLAHGTQLGRGDIARQQMQWSFGPEIEAGFQTWEDTDEQVVHARQPLGLRIDQVASPAHQQSDFQIEFGRRLDGAQIGPGADLVGDGPGVTWVGLVLAADRALAGAVDRQARHVHEREACFGQYGFGQAGDRKAASSRRSLIGLVASAYHRIPNTRVATIHETKSQSGNPTINQNTRINILWNMPIVKKLQIAMASKTNGL